MSSALRGAREAQGWTQDQLAGRLLRLAESRGAALSVSRASLKQMVSDWERGKRKPGHYRQLLCDLFGRTADELGFPDAAPAPLPKAPAHGLELMLDQAAVVDAVTVSGLQQQVDGLRRLDQQLGSQRVIEQTGTLVTTVRDLMAHVISETERQQLAGVLADVAALHGWQVLNSGDTSGAWTLHDLAKTAGRESGHPALLSHAMGEQAYDLLDVERPELALQLVQAARSAAGSKVPGLLGAWLHAAEAEALAATGDPVGCREALRLAEQAMPAEPDNSAVPYVSLDDWQLARWRGNVLAGLGDSGALDALLSALGRTPGMSVRATASLHCDVAQSYAVRGERVSSLEHARVARDLARRTGSIRQLRRIDRVTRLLA